MRNPLLLWIALIFLTSDRVEAGCFDSITRFAKIHTFTSDGPGRQRLREFMSDQSLLIGFPWREVHTYIGRPGDLDLEFRSCRATPHGILKGLLFHLKTAPDKAQMVHKLANDRNDFSPSCAFSVATSLDFGKISFGPRFQSPGQHFYLNLRPSSLLRRGLRSGIYFQDQPIEFDLILYGMPTDDPWKLHRRLYWFELLYLFTQALERMGSSLSSPHATDRVLP